MSPPFRNNDSFVKLIFTPEMVETPHPGASHKKARLGFKLTDLQVEIGQLGPTFRLGKIDPRKLRS